ncbi:MAG TPA: DUF1499 domain-containing protein [Rhizomicrobium sp.]|nr:DUF1499 domain-containing protein [Rhizomicrobium sp.]
MRILAIIAKLSFAALVVSASVGLVAALGTRFGVWSYWFGLFTLFPWCLYFGILAFALGVVWAVWALVTSDGTAAQFGAIGLVGSILVAGPPIYTYIVGSQLPAIHDISTDTEYPPPFVALKALRGGAENPPDYDGPQLARDPETGKVEASWKLQKKYYGDLRARAELIEPGKYFDRAVKAAYRMGWHVVAVDPRDGRIEATDTSFWFGVKDDIVIRVKPAGQGARIDMRSKSRVGANDFGKNAARINAYMKTLSETF